MPKIDAIHDGNGELGVSELLERLSSATRTRVDRWRRGFARPKLLLLLVLELRGATAPLGGTTAVFIVGQEGVTVVYADKRL